MTPKQTSEERAQACRAAEGFVAAVTEAAGDAVGRSMVNGSWTGGDPCSGGASLESLTRGMDLSDVRLEKVIRLRQAIASGEYRVSAADVANKLISSLTSGSGPDNGS